MVLIIALMLSVTAFSCTGVTVGTSFGVGYTGGPYGWGMYPGVRVGVYGGGYYWP